MKENNRVIYLIASIIISFLFVFQVSYAVKKCKRYRSRKAKSAYSHRVCANRKVTKEELDFINGGNYPPIMKRMMIRDAQTPAGHQALLQLMNVYLVGPTGSSVSTPIAFGADWGMVSAGLSYGKELVGRKAETSTLGLGFGLGNAHRNIGISISGNFELYHSIQKDPVGKNGSIAVQASHFFPHNLGVAAGVGNAVSWGTFKQASKDYYGVVTKVVNLSKTSRALPLSLSGGLGTGTYGIYRDQINGDDKKIRPFFSAGLRVLRNFSLIGEWTNQRINSGISVAPFKTIPIAINVGWLNMFNHDKHRYPSTLNIAIGTGHVFS
jgi:hypothetical protein